jgi:hypothetical protein
MKTYGGVDVQIHVFLTSALVRGEWSASRSVCFIPEEIAPRYPLDRRLGGPQNLSGGHGEEKNLNLTGPVIHPLLSRTRSQSLYRLRHPGLAAVDQSWMEPCDGLLLIRSVVLVRNLSSHNSSGSVWLGLVPYTPSPLQGTPTGDSFYLAVLGAPRNHSQFITANIEECQSTSSCGLFNDNFSSWAIQRPMDGRLIRKDMEGSCCGVIEVLSRQLPGGAAEGHRNVSQDSRHLHRDSNRIPPEYDPRALPLQIFSENIDR